MDSVVRSARPNELRNDNDSDNGSDNGSDNDELQVSTLVWRILRRRKKENSKRSLMTPSTLYFARAVVVCRGVGVGVVWVVCGEVALLFVRCVLLRCFYGALLRRARESRRLACQPTPIYQHTYNG